MRLERRLHGGLDLRKHLVAPVQVPGSYRGAGWLRQ